MKSILDQATVLRRETTWLEAWSLAQLVQQEDEDDSSRSGQDAQERRGVLDSWCQPVDLVAVGHRWILSQAEAARKRIGGMALV